MSDWPTSPTIEQVVKSLHRQAPPPDLTVNTIRFNPMIVMLSMISVILLATFLSLSWYLVRHVENLVIDIRKHRADLVEQARALPTSEQLAEEEDFTRELAIAPHHAAQLHLIRARLFAHRNEFERASEHFTIAESLNPRVSTTDDALTWASILATKGERLHALTLLKRIKETDLNEKQRQDFTALLLSLALEARQERNKEIESSILSRF